MLHKPQRLLERWNCSNPMVDFNLINIRSLETGKTQGDVLHFSYEKQLTPWVFCVQCFNTSQVKEKMTEETEKGLTLSSNHK